MKCFLFPRELVTIIYFCFARQFEHAIEEAKKKEFISVPSHDSTAPIGSQSFSTLSRSFYFPRERKRKSLKQVSRSKCPLIEHVRRRSLALVRDVVEAAGFSARCPAPRSSARAHVVVRPRCLRRKNVQQKTRASIEPVSTVKVCTSESMLRMPRCSDVRLATSKS